MPRIEIEPGVFFNDDIGTAYSIIKPMMAERDTLRTQLSEARATIEEQQLRLEVLYDGTESTPALVKIARLEMVIEDRDREIERLREGSIGLLDHYTGMINSGDCGNWDPESDEPVIRLRAALTPKGED
jgi:hypothetical protein